MKTLLLASAICCALFSSAEARQRHTTGLDPSCNVTMPCQAPSESSPQARRETRGRYVARQLGFGAPVTQRAVRVRKPRQVQSYGAPSPSVSWTATTIYERAKSYMPGLIRASSGATAHVAASATAAFQCIVDRLEASGYPVRFMGGLSSGHMRHSLHHVGLALDVNQFSRNVTRPAMPSNEIALANGCGLVSGAQWAHGDSGHFQLGGWAGASRHYASRHHHRYASER